MGHPSRMVFGRYDYAAFQSFFAYAAGSVVVPVALVSLARELGFSLEHGGMTSGGALHLGRTLPMVAAMLLCGFASGRWGMRRTLGVSVAFMSLGVLLCAIAPIYGVLFFALMIAGVGEGVIEGLATPFVQNLHPGEPGRYINFTHSFWSIGVLVTVVVTGVLISQGVSWRLVVAVVALLGLLATTMLLLPERTGNAYPEHPEPIHWKTIWGYALEICRIRRFWLFFAAMFVAGGGEFCLTFWCASFIQLNFLDAAWAGGLGTACFAGGMVLGRTGWGYLIKQHQLKQLIFWSAIAGTLITLFFPLVASIWVLFALLFAAGIATAPFWPSVQSHCTDRLPQADTTMLFILLSCAGIPGCGVFTWLMGYLGDHAGGLRVAFYLVPACFLVLALLIGYDWWRPASPRPATVASPDASSSEALMGSSRDSDPRSWQHSPE
ncbi:MAG: MFS transporter [Armatimonadota bacterium]